MPKTTKETCKVSRLKPGQGIRWKKHGIQFGGVIETLERDKHLTYVTFTSQGLNRWCFSNDDELQIFGN